MLGNGLIILIIILAPVAVVVGAILVDRAFSRLSERLEEYENPEPRAETVPALEPEPEPVVASVFKSTVAKITASVFKPKAAPEPAVPAQLESRLQIRLFPLIAPSVLSILCSLVFLCGASWAWFNASRASGTESIRSATFRIQDVQVAQESETPVSLTLNSDTGVYSTESLTAGTYTLSFKKKAGDSTFQNTENGYCCVIVIKDSDTVGTPYYTSNLDNSTFTLQLTVAADHSIRVTVQPVWGDVATRVSGETALASGSTIQVDFTTPVNQKKAVKKTVKSTETSSESASAGKASEGTTTAAAKTETATEKASSTETSQAPIETSQEPSESSQELSQESTEGQTESTTENTEENTEAQSETTKTVESTESAAESSAAESSEAASASTEEGGESSAVSSESETLTEATEATTEATEASSESSEEVAS